MTDPAPVVLSFAVDGIPKGQPRTKARRMGNRAQVYTPDSANGWKDAVAAVVSRQVADSRSVACAAWVRMWFFMPRPKSHYRTGKHSDLLRDSAPKEHTSKPDVDNLAKAVLDVLVEEQAIPDDRHVISLRVSKHYATHTTPGMLCIIQPFNKWAQEQLAKEDQPPGGENSATEEDDD